jgi:hypothetical protein
MANDQGQAHHENQASWSWLVVFRSIAIGGAVMNLLEQSDSGGDNPLRCLQSFKLGKQSESHAPRYWSAKRLVNFIQS